MRMMTRMRWAACGVCLVASLAMARTSLAVIDSDEGARKVNMHPSLGFSLDLGAVEPIQTGRGDHGVWGAAPDGHISVDVDGGVVRTYFQCLSMTGAQLSCLAESSSLALFTSFASLYQTGGTFQPVMDGPVVGDYYQGEYAALTSTWRDPATGTVHGWYHAENHHVPGCPSNTFWASVGYAVSTDDGHTFVKVGPVVSSSVPPIAASNCSSQGNSEPKVIARPDGYLYMLYDDWTPTDVYTTMGISIARASQADPGVWSKWYQGGFSQPGNGGLSSAVIPFVGSGTLPWSAGVTWNTSLGKYVLLHSDFVHEGSVYIRTSPNLVTWSAPQLLMAAGVQHAYRYATWVGPTDDVTGKSGWLYFGRTANGSELGGDTYLARRTIVVH